MRELTRRRNMRWVLCGLWVMMAGGGHAVLGVSKAQADRLRMRGGGEIRGHIEDDPARPGGVLVHTLNGLNPLSMSRDAIAEVIEEEDVFDHYFAQRDNLPDTAEDHHAFGLWCEENRLNGFARHHFQRAVELDDAFAPAHKKLGHVEFEGTWITYDELREAQGMVKHQGRWITREEHARIVGRQVSRDDHEAWVRRIRVLREGLGRGTPAERAETERRLVELSTPEVIPALVEVLGGDAEPSIRVLLVRLLEATPGPEATEALVGRSLRESEPTIRQSAIAALSRRGDPEAVRLLVSALGTKDLVRVSRAGAALAGLGATEAVPELLNVLVSVEKRPAWVRGSQPTTTSGAVGAVSVTGQSVPVLTGPVVGDGVVAYGAASVPLMEGVGVGMGTQPVATGPPRIQLVTRVTRNADVHNALRRLTGRDFGYDVAAWRRWLASTTARPENQPARRVPQP